MYIAIHGARHVVDGMEVVEVKCPHCEYVWLEYSDSPDYPNYCPSCGEGLFTEPEDDDELIDPTGTPLTPSFHGKDCLGNGEHPGIECCCDECPHYLTCFPDWKEHT